MKGQKTRHPCNAHRQSYLHLILIYSIVNFNMFPELSVDTCECDRLTSTLNLLNFHFLPFYKLFSNLLLDVPVLYIANYKHTLRLAVYTPSEASTEAGST